MTLRARKLRASRTANSGEDLRLRARPEPVTQIHRGVLIGTAAGGLTLLGAILLVALRAPAVRLAAPEELFRTAAKPVPDSLAKLPAAYDQVRPEPQRPSQPPPRPPLPDGVPDLESQAGAEPQTRADPDEARRTRLAREAPESTLFFRLQLKPALRGSEPASSADAGSHPHAMPLNAAPASALAGTGVGGSGDDPRRPAVAGAGLDTQTMNRHRLQTPASPYQVMAGTIIPASLVTGLNSDLPGFVIAMVTENVFDTVSGRHLLVPQGTRLVGTYDNRVAFGQKRALIVWQRLILPDGSSIVVDNPPATDSGGYAGLADTVDQHTWTLLKGVTLSTVLGVGSALAPEPGGGTGESDLVRALQQSAQGSTNRAGQRLVERHLDVQPTLTVRPGWPLNVIVHKDLVLRPYPRVNPR